MKKLFIIFSFALCFFGNIQDSLGFSYTMPSSFDGITLKGDASLKTSYVALTKEDSAGRSTGRVIYPSTVPLFAASFSTSFVFQIITFDNYSPGDGMAFFISPLKNIPKDSSGGRLGLVSWQKDGKYDNRLFAVEFDTYSNVWDPSYEHIGIDINGLTSNATVAMDFDSNSTYTAWIDYDNTAKTVEVRLEEGEEAEKPTDPQLSLSVDLGNIVKDNKMYIGFSAATYSSYEHHRLYSWSFSTN